MYHVHLLSPYRFYEDTQRMMIPHMMFIPLPLEQLHVQRNAPNESSVAFWREKCGDGDEPFKLTVEDLYKPLPSFRNCPYCKKGYKINSADYGKWRVDANTLLRCWCCDKDFNVHDASVAQILEDLAHSPIPKTETDQLAWLRGTLLNNTGNVRRVLTEDRPANAVAGMLLRFHRHEEKVIPGSLAFSEFILTSVSGKTKSMYEIEAILVKQLHFRALDQGWKKPEEKAKREKLLDFTSCINACYSNNPSPFSLNLIQAAEKQYRESIRLLSIPWVYPDTVIRGIRHYKAFLSLFAQRDHELRQLPPTQTELVWRLHMMFPMQYRDLTLKCTGRVVNHEDNIRNLQVDSTIFMDYVHGTALVDDPIDDDDDDDDDALETRFGSPFDTDTSSSYTCDRCSGHRSSTSYHQHSYSSSLDNSATESSSTPSTLHLNR
ncbi:hypothetical protein DM01DRAFT_1118873 [Hesseltinella vesiculosa]|uniref:Uncharacterized protein n=1 Tax=Hesseltinella vesiculosa TaxID=101127 RepID=A0A1X2GTE9_9FUNG|nr:hypothetical protein DM01DRAFT_1118873 [Hesseltinella vesiculosa]